jgi:5'-deoxynucleotidase YfbR-like HD superfamily hydrolase
MDDRLGKQMRFVVEMDKLKQVLRRNTLTDGSRRENSAEHSWHLALMTAILAEHATSAVDPLRVMLLVLVHDIVEIDAGDTFAYDLEGAATQAEREAQAADRIFALLPADQAAAFRELWLEFERRDTEDARFAVALDRLQPLLQNIECGGGTWRTHGITEVMVRARCAAIGAASPRLGAFVDDLIALAVSQSMIEATEIVP